MTYLFVGFLYIQKRKIQSKAPLFLDFFIFNQKFRKKGLF